MKKYFIICVLIISSTFISAQNSNPTTNDIQYSVLSESIEKTNEAQELIIEIRKNTIETPNYIVVSLENMDSFLTLFEAKLDNEDLWLLKSNVASKDEKIIAWDYDKKTSQLFIYPYNWKTNYTLELNIQVNIKDISSVENKNSERVVVTADINDQLLNASATGRGNEIQIR